LTARVVVRCIRRVARAFPANCYFREDNINFLDTISNNRLLTYESAGMEDGLDSLSGSPPRGRVL
jgi:hypothetical protein